MCLLIMSASSTAAGLVEQHRATTQVAAHRGGLFLGYFLLAAQKKVTSTGAAPRNISKRAFGSISRPRLVGSDHAKFQFRQDFPSERVPNSALSLIIFSEYATPSGVSENVIRNKA